MGVHGLWKLIETSGKAVPLEALENRVLAVDVSIWLYQLVKGFQETSGHTVANAFLLGLFHRICKLLFYRIKPIFVFDGGVPVLKRRTIADRQSSRNKANRHIEKLRQTLFENLAKQDALGQVLGESVILPKPFQPKQDNLFQLPPLPNTDDVESDGSSGENETGLEKYKYKDIHSIDINSEEFLSLPPDMRHDILTELKETRKQSSWGKLHLIPKERNEFSDYQMQRLLKRRAVQVGIEKAESEMGTRGFTISDLQTILSDQGIDLAQRIAADNRTKLLYTDKSKESINGNLKRTSTISKSYKPTKRTKLVIDANFEEVEDDPEICSSSISCSEEEEGLSQKEILQLIKQENQPPVIQKGPDVSPRDQGEMRNSEAGREEALTVHDEAVENKTGNNVLKLEHGSLPWERSSCQQSSCLEVLSQASIELTNAAFPESTESTNTLNTKQGHNIIKTFKNISDPKSLETPKNLLRYATKSNDCEQKRKRLEVLNYLNKVKEEITSPLKMPTLPDIKIKHEYIAEESVLPIQISNLPVNNNICETSDESECEVETNSFKIKVSSAEFHVAKKNEESEEVQTANRSEANCSKLSDYKVQKFVSEHSDSEDELIEVENKSDEVEVTDVIDVTKQNLKNLDIKNDFIDLNPKVGEIQKVQVINDEFKKDSEESDSELEFIEVKSDREVFYDEPKTASSTSIGDLKDAHDALEIVISSTDKLEDDLFADIFQDLPQQKNTSPNAEKKLEVSVESNTSIKLNSEYPKDIILVNKSPKLNEKPTQSSYPEVLLPSDHDNHQALLHNDIDFVSEKEVSRIPSPVPHFSTDEIMKMKRDLEQESRDLMIEAQREDRIASTITEQIRLDAQELLQLFGIPYIIAPMEAEAQCAFLDLTGQTQGTITDDSDIWLFGGKNVYKNFFDQKKFVMQFKSTDIARVLHLERDDMIMLALLTGSDYTLGLNGVGAVTALEIVAHYPKNDTEPSPFERLHHFAAELQQNKLSGNMAKKLKKASITEGFPSVEVINAYLEPEVDTSQEKFSWSKPNLNELRRYAREKFGWDKSRTDKILEPVLENLNRTQTQGTLHNFFEWKFDTISTQRSRRVENAISLMKSSNLTAEPGPSKVGPPIVRNSMILSEADKELPVKSKTPAQIAREKAAKKFKELKKKSKKDLKSRKK